MPISPTLTEGSVPVADGFRGTVHSVMHERGIRVSTKHPARANEEATVRQVLPETELKRLSGRLRGWGTGIIRGMVV